ncbi:MAG: ComEC/Rec2 family competence protein [Leeuwenhoekiella sp.]
MRGINFPLFALLIGLCCGILLSEIFQPELSLLMVLLLAGTVIFGIYSWFFRKRIERVPVSLILASSLFLIIGLFFSFSRLPENQPDHFQNFQEYFEIKTPLQLQITEVLRPNDYASRYYAEIHSTKNQKIRGKVILTVSKDSSDTEKQLPVDTQIYLSTTLEKLPKLNHPYQFDYSGYLRKQDVFGQIHAQPSEILILTTDVYTLKGQAYRIRSQIISKLKPFEFAADEWAVVNALLLGQRNELDDSLRQSYIDAGLIHILAVSGLHVGIVMLLLQYLLNPLGNFRSIRIFRMVVIIAAIWGFAILTGASPSILRAATMFTFIQIGLLLNNRAGGYNALIISAFILLLVNPNLLFQVGFQLSYLAVFGIFWLQPAIYRFWQPKFWVTKKLWSIASVTLAAQLGVLPLSIFYFHQIPLLFLFANIVVLPFLGLILGGGICIILLAMLGILPDFLAQGYEHLIFGLNAFIKWIASAEDFVLRNLFISPWELIALFALVLAFGLLLREYSYHRLMNFFLSLTLFPVANVYKQVNSAEEHLYIFNQYRETRFALQQGKQMTFFSSYERQQNNIDGIGQNVLQASVVDEIYFKPLPNIFRFKRKNILVIDKDGIFDIPDLTANYILLSNSPKINFDRLLQTHPNAFIIADASNYKTYTDRWRKSCAQKKVPFYSTYELGFFEIQ